MRPARLLTVVAFTLTPYASAAEAAEVCGNEADDDTDNSADEGCYPHLVTGVCESPLSCEEDGAVGPKLGGLYYQVKPDVVIQSNRGPNIVFRRFYTSLYAPTYFQGGNTDFHAPLGYRWQHSYMSWVKRNGSLVILHGTDGKEIKFAFAQTVGGYDYYTPQPGYHFIHFRRNTTTGNWELKFLNGWTHYFEWAATSQIKSLTGIEDAATTPNRVIVSYSASNQIYRVTSADTTRYIEFTYSATSPKLLSTVKVYGPNVVTPTTYTYAYTSNSLSSVTATGGAVIGKYTYTSNYLVGAGASTTLDDASFSYVTGGQIRTIKTARGKAYHEYAVTCPGGAGGSGLKVHFGTTGVTCSTDAQCGTGTCRGGECYKANRCLTIASPNEDLVTDVSGSCATCVDTKHYEWWTDTNNTKLELRGTLSAEDVRTSTAYDTNGNVVRTVENDTDYDALNVIPASARTTYNFYTDATYPGLVTEVRRQSELSTASCTDTVSTGCKRTIYTYTQGQVQNEQDAGFTLDETGSAVPFSHTTQHAYDSNGRETQVSGPVQDALRTKTYCASGGCAAGDVGYLSSESVRKTPSATLTRYQLEYTTIGGHGCTRNPTSVVTCDKVDEALGTPKERRQVVNGTTMDCTVVGSQDLTDQYTYDAYRRLTKIQRPRGNCTHFVYDTSGRVSERITADKTGPGTCGATGEKETFSYDSDGRLTYHATKNENGQTVAEETMTYDSDRRLKTVVNPVTPSVSKMWTYFADGVPQEIREEDFSTSGARTVWEVDALNRSLSKKDGTSPDLSLNGYTFSPAIFENQPRTVTNEAGKTITLDWDDLGRKVREGSPEGQSNVYVYDEAGNLITEVRAVGTPGQVITRRTYDLANRLLTVDTGDSNCAPNQSVETSYDYDALPGGDVCPSGSTCLRLDGKLARVRKRMFCDGTQPDSSFDQYTYYSYDVLGRVQEHTIRDDAGRLTRFAYVYDGNGNVTQIQYPGTTLTYAYGDGTSASNDDKPVSIQRDGATMVIENIGWYPFGTEKTYDQSIVLAHGTKARVQNTLNLGRRFSSIDVRSIDGLDPVSRIDFTEDLRGSYASRDFSYGTSAQKDAFFLTDQLLQTICRRTLASSGCGAGEGGQMETVTYDAARRRFGLILNTAAISTTAFYGYWEPTDQLAVIGNGAFSVYYNWDWRGNCTYDDDTRFSGADEDLRSFSFDAENNLISVMGKYLAPGGGFNTYVVSNAYDERSQRVFKSFKDTVTGKEAQWFFYYDLWGRLSLAKHTPDISNPSTYSVFDWTWLGQKPINYRQQDFPSATLTVRTLEIDEQGRPHAAWNAGVGVAYKEWEVEAGLFGWDIPVVGASVFQPLRFPGQYYDRETEVVSSAGALLRPGITQNGRRAYDSYTGRFVQVDPRHAETWQAYSYSGNNPVDRTDPIGTAWTICVELSFGRPIQDPRTGEIVDVVPTVRRWGDCNSEPDWHLTIEVPPIVVHERPAPEPSGDPAELERCYKAAKANSPGVWARYCASIEDRSIRGSCYEQQDSSVREKKNWCYQFWGDVIELLAKPQ